MPKSRKNKQKPRRRDADGRRDSHQPAMGQDQPAFQHGRAFDRRFYDGMTYAKITYHFVRISKESSQVILKSGKHCESCTDGKATSTAVCFCNDCREYLCQKHLDCHKGVTVTRHHTILPLGDNVYLAHGKESTESTTNTAEGKDVGCSSDGMENANILPHIVCSNIIEHRLSHDLNNAQQKPAMDTQKDKHKEREEENQKNNDEQPILPASEECLENIEEGKNQSQDQMEEKPAMDTQKDKHKEREEENQKNNEEQPILPASEECLENIEEGKSQSHGQMEEIFIRTLKKPAMDTQKDKHKEREEENQKNNDEQYTRKVV
ncbi:tripartite motif-containing protein 44-like isoform X2 [Mercenaria mercenaria]|uniref:tripartite motif-containing protein 44-like isoform X2 n=1 Tax=Mercenaria mercenaria TaxID=6596 RepID=UPI00234EB9D2|nr:tripartite motif-containing protein 44-like isoform X2 [Mercenaria mercenaria]